jgi:anthranilate phosphoribosyltransferase
VAPFPSVPGAVDTCGTGGDGKGTFNLSTAAGLTTAALGTAVAKHGNRNVSSACGSADLLEGSGFPIAETAQEASNRLSKRRFAFLFAPLYHPAMAHVAPVRRALGVRTVFNLLGPLLNPAAVKRQVVGVFDANRMELMARSLQALGTERALVIHSQGGYDEAVLHAPVRVVEVTPTALEGFELSAADFGLPEGRPEDLAGGSLQENLRLLLGLLSGGGPSGLRAAVAANAALALGLDGDRDLMEDAGLAFEALGSGAVGRYFEELVALTEEDERAQVS